MKRELTPKERDAVIDALIAHDRVKAISIYLSATEGNLSQAQKFMTTLTAEIALAGATASLINAPFRS
jgi:hypothetical protein